MAAPKDKNISKEPVVENVGVVLPDNALLIKSFEQDGVTIEQKGFMVYQGVVVVDTEIKDGILIGVKIRFSRDAKITPVTLDGKVVSGDLSERR